MLITNGLSLEANCCHAFCLSRPFIRTCYEIGPSHISIVSSIRSVYIIYRYQSIFSVIKADKMCSVAL